MYTLENRQRKEYMKKYRIILGNGESTIVEANSSLEVVKKYDLATRKHIHTRIVELQEYTLKRGGKLYTSQKI